MPVLRFQLDLRRQQLVETKLACCPVPTDPLTAVCWGSTALLQ
jgi:hypothetical protein